MLTDSSTPDSALVARQDIRLILHRAKLDGASWVISLADLGMGVFLLVCPDAMDPREGRNPFKSASVIFPGWVWGLFLIGLFVLRCVSIRRGIKWLCMACAFGSAYFFCLCAWSLWRNVDHPSMSAALFSIVGVKDMVLWVLRSRTQRVGA